MPVVSLTALRDAQPFDAFWSGATRPDNALFQAFRTTLLHTAQINGGFYCRTGIELAIANAVLQLEAQHSPLETLLSCLPNAA